MILIADKGLEFGYDKLCVASKLRTNNSLLFNLLSFNEDVTRGASRQVFSVSKSSFRLPPGFF